jgi:hypothetical protein
MLSRFHRVAVRLAVLFTCLGLLAPAAGAVETHRTDPVAWVASAKVETRRVRVVRPAAAPVRFVALREPAAPPPEPVSHAPPRTRLFLSHRALLR